MIPVQSGMTVATAPRSDIQALRGLAVLLVIVQHAKAGLLPAGYLGVDIFFVVSGYLITGMLAREHAQGGIRFGAFYFRRARRLLPAACVTFASTALLGYFLLDAVEWRDFTRQLAGAVTFTANFILLEQTGYFAHAAELKPLLHVWSLAVEEQFYLVLPALLALAPRRAWPPLLALLLVVSLALCLWWEATRPDAAFYLLPARAWELAIGALIALWPAHEASRNAAVRRLFVPALLALLVVPLWPSGLSRVAGVALVCLATAVVILRGHEALAGRPIPNVLAKIGDASYSLYLVHWPIFAFLNNAYAGDPSFGTPSTPVLVACVVLSLLLGFALHRCIEEPCRRVDLRSPQRWLATAVVASLLLAVVPAGIEARSSRANDGKPAIDFVALRQDNLGFGATCEAYRRFDASAGCRNVPAPRLLVWGDSFAMHLVDGLAATAPGGVLQATKSACGPVLGLAQVAGTYTRDYAANCIEFNDSVMVYLEATPRIDTVVLSAAFFPYFDPQRRLLVREGDALADRDPGMDIALAALAATVRRIRAAGKRVVLVAPPPSNGFDYTHCIERRIANRNPLRRFVDCDIPQAQYHASKRGLLEFLQRARQHGAIEVLSLEPALCDGNACKTMLEDAVVYRDEGHLSHAGSVAVARALDLGLLVERHAR